MSRILLVVAFLCVTLTTTAQKILQFDTMEILSANKSEHTEKTVSTFVLYENEVVLSVEGSTTKFNLEKDTEQVTTHGRDWIVKIGDNGIERFILFFSKSNDAVLVMKDENNAVIFYNE